jgi:16S rRNA (cytidine1402-2'-O)-methyltransferase
VSLIAAEDTRRARILTRRYEIETPVTSYFEGNKLTKLDQVLDALASGDVAVVSEAGMPGLSDPGYELVQAALERGYPVVPIPGASAPVTALVASGLPTDTFLFLGFLPRRRGERRQFLSAVSRLRHTLIFFEAPHRVRESLADLESLLGDRPVAIGRELTKLHEEIWRGSVSAARAHFEAVEPRGEFTLVVGGAPQAQRTWDEAQVRAALADLHAQGVSPSKAARRVASLAGWPRSDVYALGLEMKADGAFD